MSWLSSFLHPQRGYKAGQEVLDKYYNQAQGNLQPYNQNGLDTYGKYSGAMDKLLNPGGLQDEWLNNYKESDAAKIAEGMAKEHGLDAASSMGLMGSNPAIQAVQAGTAGIQAQDKEKYLDNMMQKYLAGIGIGQDIYGKGLNSATNMSTNAMTQGQNSAGLKFGEMNAPGEMFGQGGAMIAKLIQQYLTGGMGEGDYGRGAWSPTGG